jgi:hypothetical protein
MIITVGVPKGGDHKTWTTMNLCSLFGLWGYDVLAVDTNAQHDLYTDYKDINLNGYWPRYEMVRHHPFTRERQLAPAFDFKPHMHHQFIVVDTSQYLELPTTLWAWSNCDALILPVSPKIAQVGNYRTGIQSFRALNGERKPIIVLACSARVLRNSKLQERFEWILRAFKEEGCLVASSADGDIYTQDHMIPESEMMGIQENRWIFSETEVGGVRKRLSEDFVLRVIFQLTWIRAQLEAFYGWFPKPKLKPLNVASSFQERAAMLEELRREQANRSMQTVGTTS